MKNLQYDIFSVVSHYFIMYIIPHVLIHSFDAYVWPRCVQTFGLYYMYIASFIRSQTPSACSTTYITCPADPKKTLGIKLPFLVMIIKNQKKYFSFEVQVLDDKNVRRRFRASNYQSTTKVNSFSCTMPMRLDDGWNQIQFNLSDFTRRAYGTNYSETLRVQVCRRKAGEFVNRLFGLSLLSLSDSCQLSHPEGLLL
uniref:Cilia and flagella associated protein 20 n=1 Tax=Oryzias latipes TaxID=8090 RepID=A0A3P9HQP4_ORYLA